MPKVWQLKGCGHERSLSVIAATSEEKSAETCAYPHRIVDHMKPSRDELPSLLRCTVDVDVNLQSLPRFRLLRVLRFPPLVGSRLSNIRRQGILCWLLFVAQNSPSSIKRCLRPL